MSSTNKTSNLELNQWLGSDAPQMSDFNKDNAIVDAVISEHKTDAVAHVTSDERIVWNNPYYIQSFYGDGKSSRTLTAQCSFTPSWGIIFSASYPGSVSDFANKVHYNYFGIFSKRGSMPGLSLTNYTLNITQSLSISSGSQMRSYNENGISYVVIFFR